MSLNMIIFAFVCAIIITGLIFGSAFLMSYMDGRGK